jgi:site-specific DNA-methyltransferase (adenine-specific)
MESLPNALFDMILCDLPYGTTQCKWDSVISFEKLWLLYWRIAKPNAAIVLTASQPFTSALIISQIAYFRYEWIWEKGKATGHLDVNKKPLKAHENICVFYKKQPVYNPIKEQKEGYSAYSRKPQPSGKSRNDKIFGAHGSIRYGNEDGLFYPRSVQFVSHETKGFHPTQKPVALFEYLIKTYTNENSLVLDNCAGSGTTAIACENLKRRWVCIEKDETFANQAVARIIQHQ